MTLLQVQSNALQVQVAKNADCRTDIVESLTDCDAYISSDGKKKPQEMLLKI